MLLSGALVSCELYGQCVLGTVVKAAAHGVWVRYGAAVVKLPLGAVSAPVEKQLTDMMIGSPCNTSNPLDLVDVQYAGKPAPTPDELLETSTTSDVSEEQLADMAMDSTCNLCTLAPTEVDLMQTSVDEAAEEHESTLSAAEVEFLKSAVAPEVIYLGTRGAASEVEYMKTVAAPEVIYMGSRAPPLIVLA